MTSKTLATFSRSSLLAIASLLAACGGQRMSVGANDNDDSARDAPRHCNGGTPTGDLDATTQEQLDALLGCEVFDGSLRIQQPEEAAELSLSSLASLRVVTGSLDLSGINSLAGLEALEQVGNLALQDVGAYDLVALSNLQRVIWDPPGGGDGGLIGITSCANLQGLDGLQRLNTWTSLSIDDAPRLATLLGLAGPPKLRNLTLSRLPVLANLQGLEFAREVDYVLIQSTGLVSLRGFSLARTQSLQIRVNSELTDLDGLSRLYAADQLLILDNDRLSGVQLGSLSQTQSISITGNDALTRIFAYGVSEGTGFSVRDSEFVALNRALFEVGNNAKLQDIAGPDGFAQVQKVSIWGNPALTHVSLNHLQRADGLEILDNPALTTLIVPQLERVGDLDVVNNPQLSTAALDDVQTFTRTMSGNGAAPAPAAP